MQAAAVPELTDEVARGLGAEDADDVRSKVRQRIEQQERQGKASQRLETVVDQLLAKVDFPVPPSLHAMQRYQILMRMYQQASQQGMPPEELQNKLESMRDEADQAALRAVRRKLVLEKIAEAEDIKVSRQELDSTVSMIARYQQVTPKKCIKQLQDSGHLMELVDDIRGNRTLHRIIELNEKPAAEPAQA